jgi:hypothetical protein
LSDQSTASSSTATKEEDRKVGFVLTKQISEKMKVAEATPAKMKVREGKRESGYESDELIGKRDEFIMQVLSREGPLLLN